VGTPDGTGHRGPGLLEGEHTLDIVTSDFLTRDGVNNGGLNTEERQRGTTGLGGGDTTKGSDDVGTSLGLPVGVTNVSLLLANLLEVPLPDFRSNGLTDRAKDTQVLHLVLDVLVTSTLEQAQSGGSNVELSNLVLLDNIPIAREVGVGGGTFENNGGTSQEQRSVDDIGVTSDPANVTTAEEAVIVVDVKDVLTSHGSTEQVTSGGVHDTLGLTGGTGGVEQEERVFGVDRLRREVVGVLLNLLVPPEVTTRGPRDLSTGPLVDENAGDIRALLESLVNNALGTNDLATTATLISGDNDLGASIEDTVTEGVRGETGEDDGVDSTNTGASKESNESLRNHRKVDGNGVTLLDTLLLESPGNAGNLTQKLSVCDGAALAGLIGLVDNGGLVGVFESMTVDTVERGVQTTLNEPGNVTVDERTGAGGLEVLVEGEELAGHASPEGVGITDGLFVQLLVLVEVFKVSACGVLVIEGLGDVEGIDLVGLGDLQRLVPA